MIIGPEVHPAPKVGISTKSPVEKFGVSFARPSKCPGGATWLAIIIAVPNSLCRNRSAAGDSRASHTLSLPVAGSGAHSRSSIPCRQSHVCSCASRELITLFLTDSHPPSAGLDHCRLVRCVRTAAAEAGGILTTANKLTMRQLTIRLKNATGRRAAKRSMSRTVTFDLLADKRV